MKARDDFSKARKGVNQVENDHNQRRAKHFEPRDVCVDLDFYFFLLCVYKNVSVQEVFDSVGAGDDGAYGRLVNRSSHHWP
jgi:hypothetical protein